ncbi:short-chain dehydrogenase [Paraliobacillus quinghaiensis]|uniref:Short-chain dehydrogenase n=1 Tax=Paraliobacillus quinghaiensis TaxID=470815 RepID=A0A917WSQ3_9BACI|nr:(S)-benzoin forming benzil reductase [Paraliobacillus quinghaiensis]GGM25657.1 short-chain dehydrogenase [Paraliobacillus quinghaiensis]
MKYAVITGTSRGLGESIAKLLMQQGIHVIGVARHANKSLKKLAQETTGSYQDYACNLANGEETEKIFSIIADQLFKKQTDIVYLIHNAGTVNPINTADKHTVESLNSHVHVNLIAPMITTGVFLKKANKTKIPLIVTSVTSGAADRSVYGWSAYCGTKAGLNRYTTSVALEQDQLATSNKVILFDPSIMDTDMQEEIRSTSKEAFQDVDKFQKYKEEDSLRDTDTVANVLVDILMDSENVVNGEYYSVKDVL